MKRLARVILGWLGIELYGARGGAYFCEAPRAGSAERPRSLPSPCRIQLRRSDRVTSGRVEVNGGTDPAGSFESGYVRMPEIADHTVDDLELTGVYEFLFRQDRLHAIREWRRILKPGRSLTLRGLPDFEAIAGTYVAARTNGSSGASGSEPGFGLDEVFRRTHGDPATANGSAGMLKDVFTRESLSAELGAAGYEIVSIENVRRTGEPAALWLDVVARNPA